jgi:hypothetical protein
MVCNLRPESRGTPKALARWKAASAFGPPCTGVQSASSRRTSGDPTASPWPPTTLIAMRRQRNLNLNPLRLLMRAWALAGCEIPQPNLMSSPAHAVMASPWPSRTARIRTANTLLKSHVYEALRTNLSRATPSPSASQTLLLSLVFRLSPA